ncbi:MAG: FlgD immunoglobulin-like domain containing protein [bacterium]
MKRKHLATAFILIMILLPALGLCQTCVDFQSLVLGTQYGTPVGNTPGQIIFTENGIPVSVDNFNFVTGGVTFNLCQVDPAFAGFGTGNTMQTNNINLFFDFTALGFAPNRVSFEFADKGGDENISVNGQLPIFAGELIAAPPAIAPGVTLSISTRQIQDGIAGTVVLTGPVNTLLIGGQEFWLDDVCAEDTTITGIGDNPSAVPKDFALGQNFPNPFNPETEIRFYLPKESHVVLKIFNTLGEEIRTLVKAKYAPGSYSVRWDATDKKENVVSSGVYFYQIQAGTFSQVKKMILLR